MTDTNKLTEWVINKIKTEYPDDIALLVAVENASVNGDGHGEAFDYFVPATGRGFELAQTFIINGVGNDLYPRSWERCERTASLDDRATLCLGDAKILYARTNEDAERFEAIRQKLFDNLRSPEFVYKKALEGYESAMNLYRTLMFEERLWKVRCLTGFIFDDLLFAVHCLNGTYWKAWHFGIFAALGNLKTLPDNFAELYNALLSATTTGELKSVAHLLIASARRFIAGYKPQADKNAPDYGWLADWYQELRTTWNRLNYFCDTHNADAASCDAVNLQNELSIISDEFSLEEFDLLGCFDAKDLSKLKRRAKECEDIIIAAIEGQGIAIKHYDSVDAFIAANPIRT
jgi:hypothetical protein